jgi:hypothetical protein
MRKDEPLQSLNQSLFAEELLWRVKLVTQFVDLLVLIIKGISIIQNYLPFKKRLFPFSFQFQ